MKILFIGLGSIGLRHARLLNKMTGHELFALKREGSNYSNVTEFPVTILESWEDVIYNRPDVAFITNPTSIHISTALHCAQIGCKLFVEKPLGHQVDGLDALCNYINSNRIVSYVAYNLRFHPVIEKLKEVMNNGTFLHMSVQCSSFLPSWRPGVDVKTSYSSHTNQGGGVVLDLSHEIDYTEYLLGTVNNIVGGFSRRSDLTVDSEDWADMLLSCKKGPASIHVNFFSQINQRTIVIDCKEFSIRADLINNTLQEFVGGSEVNRHEFDCPRDYTYERQLEYFFNNIDNENMMNNIPAASETLKKILFFKENQQFYG